MSPCHATHTGRKSAAKRRKPPAEWSTTSACASSVIATTKTRSKKSSSHEAWRSPLSCAVSRRGGVNHGSRRLERLAIVSTRRYGPVTTWTPARDRSDTLLHRRRQREPPAPGDRGRGGCGGRDGEGVLAAAAAGSPHPENRGGKGTPAV